MVVEGVGVLCVRLGEEVGLAAVVLARVRVATEAQELGWVLKEMSQVGEGWRRDLLAG